MDFKTWYDELTQYAAERGATIPEQRALARYWREKRSIQDTYEAIFATEQTIEPESQKVSTTVNSNAVSYARTAGPTVSERDVIARIASVDYSLSPTGNTIICEMVMVNGWGFIGMSTPVSPDNFDLNKGRSNARQDCIKQATLMEAYLLKERIYQDYVAAQAAGTIGITDQSV